MDEGQDEGGLARIQSRPRALDGLQRQYNDHLKEKHARLRAEHDQLRTDIKQLVRVVHVLEVEYQQLRQPAGKDSVARVLPVQQRSLTR
ncbi:hypothetical protein [Streptomyces sp. NPDC057636]|uniref:hypothetical protein n=1 Tax=Streptomyces sp. NPDC057636 TaxID=3346189 RepID=UPI0036917F27